MVNFERKLVVHRLGVYISLLTGHALLNLKALPEI